MRVQIELDAGRPFRLWNTAWTSTPLPSSTPSPPTAVFGRAARATTRAKTTLSRRVSDLERQLGVRLFERGTGSLRLTEEGRALLASTQEPLGELAAAESALRGGGAEPRGRLRVSVPLMFGQHIMGELAARFIARYPLVRLEIVTDDRYVDLVQEGFDVAIRAKPKPDEDLVGRCVLRDHLLVVASPALERPAATADGRPAPVAAVVRAIGEDTRPWIVEEGDRRFVLDPDPVLKLSTLAISGRRPRRRRRSAFSELLCTRGHRLRAGW